MDLPMTATRLLFLLTLLLIPGFPSSHAQAKAGRAGDLKGLTVPDDPERPEPAARDFRDRSYGVAFHVPVGWNFERKDGILSNFGTDVRSARRGLDVRGVGAINFNPYPPTTFAGAMFYYSVIPRSDAKACAAEATTGYVKPKADAQIAGVSFKH